MSINRANKGLITPVTLTFLLFSFTILTVATYYVAITSVNSKAGRLNYAAAKQDMLIFESSISSVIWSPGSSIIQNFQGYGGEFGTKPELRRLAVNLTMGSTSEIVFNSTVGYVRYELPTSDRNDIGRYMRGDDDSVINRSFSSMAQLYVRLNGDDQELYLGYRPLAVSFLDASETNTVNVVRIHIVNLNASESLLFTGSFRVRALCVNVTTETRNYNLVGDVSLAEIRVTSEGNEGTVLLPLTSEDGSTVVRVEILVCNVRLEEVSV